MLVSSGDTVICSHPLLTGNGQRSQQNEHFEGLLKRIRNEPCMSPKKKQVQKPCIGEYPVEERNLALYDALCEVGER